jgi:predicted dehydrogenase
MGAGRIARVHAAVLASGVAGGVRLAGVCDIRPERAEILARKMSVPAFSALSEMVDVVADLDAVAVLTESGNHARHALAVMAAGKHVVLEKPAALTVSDIDRVRAAEKESTRVAVVHQNRFNKPVAATRRALSAGAFGTVVMVAAHVAWGRSPDYYASAAWRGTRTLDGGALANQGVHHLDLLIHLFGTVRRVQATASRFKHRIESEDTLSALLEFRSGVQGVLQVTTAADRDHEGSLTITGTNGFVRLGGKCLNRIDAWEASWPRPELGESADYSALGIPSLYGFGHVDFYRDFARSLVAGSAFCCELSQARDTVSVLEDVYAAAGFGPATGDGDD